MAEQLSKHTPGPWTARGPNMLEIRAGENPVAIVAVRIPQRQGEYAEAEANAQLIAAAPTLLKAVKLALLEFERIAYQKKADAAVIRCLNGAIQKADGSNA